MPAKKESVNIVDEMDKPLPEKLHQELVGRVSAPNVHIDAPYHDERFAQVARLDKSDPDFVHCYQSKGITQDELDAKGMEVVKGKDGKALYHRGDIVCRQEKVLFERERKRDALMSRKQIKEINDGKDLTKFRSPKSPIDFGGDDELDKELAELG